VENPFKGRHFQADIILICIRWYLRYALGYRDIEEMMTERGLSVDHTTVYRWVQEYAPELDKRSRLYLKQTNDSWRVDETYVKCSIADQATLYGVLSKLRDLDMKLVSVNLKEIVHYE
jgi:transposase-like protein